MISGEDEEEGEKAMAYKDSGEDEAKEVPLVEEVSGNKGLPHVPKLQEGTEQGDKSFEESEKEI